MASNKEERDFTDFDNMPFGKHPVPILFDNVADAGDGHPGLQRAVRNWSKKWLSGGIMDHDIDIGSQNFSGNEITGDIVSGNQAIHTYLTGDNFKSSTVDINGGVAYVSELTGDIVSGNQAIHTQLTGTRIYTPEITGDVVSGNQAIHTQLTGTNLKSSSVDIAAGNADLQDFAVSGSFCMFNQAYGFAGRTDSRNEGEVYYDTSGDSLYRWQTGATTASGGAWIEIGT